jgi:hypothetical protein
MALGRSSCVGRMRFCLIPVHVSFHGRQILVHLIHRQQGHLATKDREGKSNRKVSLGRTMNLPDDLAKSLCSLWTSVFLPVK